MGYFNVEIKNIIDQIFDQFGITILLSGSRFCALIGDMAPSMKLERRVMHRLEQEMLLPAIYQELTDYGKIGKKNVKVELLLDEAGFSEEWKNIVLSAFGFLNDEDMFDILPDENDVTVTPESNTEVLIMQLLDDAFDEVTINGPIIVEDSLTTNTYIEIVDGIKINRGFISPYMVQDQKRVETILEDPYILITNAILTERITIQKIADLVNPTKKSLLIIATYVEQAALSEIVKKLDSFPCVAVMAPSYGDRRVEILKDIAILTGGTAIIETNEKCVNDITLENLGQAEKVIVRSEETIIVNGKGDKNALKERKYNIWKLKEQSYSDYDKEKLQERYENLDRGVAVIKVGGKTVSETRRVMEMIDTALFNLRNSTCVTP